MTELLTPAEVAQRIGAGATKHSVVRIAKEAGTFTRFIRNQIVFTEDNYRALVDYITNPPRPQQDPKSEDFDPFAPTPRTR